MNNKTKLKALAGNKYNLAQMMEFINDSVENIASEGQNAGYQQWFQYPSLSGSLTLYHTIPTFNWQLLGKGKLDADHLFHLQFCSVQGMGTTI